MSLIAFTTKLDAGTLLGNGHGVTTTPLNEEQFLKELDHPNFRGIYIGPNPSMAGTKYGEGTDLEDLAKLKHYLKTKLSVDVIENVQYIHRMFQWTAAHDIIYYMEPFPHYDGSVVGITFLKIERVKNDYISES